MIRTVETVNGRLRGCGSLAKGTTPNRKQGPAPQAQVPVEKSSLSPSCAQLVELMQWLGFGTIYGQHVRDGEPIFTPPPRVVREIKFGGDNGPHAMAKSDDFVLKQQVRDFLAQLDAIGTGIILSLEVKHGLPFRMTIEEVHS